jgi:hypothetical protein
VWLVVNDCQKIADSPLPHFAKSLESSGWHEIPRKVRLSKNLNTKIDLSIEGLRTGPIARCTAVTASIIISQVGETAQG